MENVPQQIPKKTNPALWIVLAIVVIIVAAAIIYYWQTTNSNTNTNVANTNTGTNANTALNTNVSSNTNTSANSNTSSNTNTNVDTTGWKTYENTRFKYSFEYPATWLPLDSPDNSLPTPENFKAGFGGANIEFRFDVKNLIYYKCDSFEDCMSKFPDPNSGTTSSPTKVMIDGQEAIYQKVERGTWTDDVWYVYRNNQYMIIYAISGTSEYAAAKPILNAIISAIDFK